MHMDDLDLMKFQHWLPSRDSDDNWTSVALDYEVKESDISYDYNTISVLAETDDVKKLVSDHNWLEDIEYGNQKVWSSNGKVNHDFKPISEKNGVRIEPFVIMRSWSAKGTEIQYEIIQDFVMFYNLLFNREENTYQAIKDNGEITDVVKIIHDKDCKKINIKTDYLRNYLTFKNKFLVRQHDHRTGSVKSISDLGSARFEKDYEDPSYNFWLVIDDYSGEDEKSFSRILGKDVILPLSKRKDLLGWEEKYCEFIIGVTSEFENIEVTCEEDKLGNYFKKSEPHFLTPVFFNREVLKRYHDTPSKYTVTSTYLSCGNLWGLPIDINTQDFVQVYLGDLGHIPYNEQCHWKNYNVRPSGGISPSRFQRDFGANFTDSEEPICRFTKSLKSFQERFSKKYGFYLFMPLTDKDRFNEIFLRIPINNEQPEFEQQMGSLAKILPDSIDVSQLKCKIKEKGFNSKEFNGLQGSIQKLKFFFEKENIDLGIITHLNKIQQIRSTGIAHRKGDKFEIISQKYKLDKTNNVEFFKNLIHDLINSFEKSTF